MTDATTALAAAQSAAASSDTAANAATGAAESVATALTHRNAAQAAAVDAQSAASTAATDALAAVTPANDVAIAAVDADAGSAFRVQQDARLLTTIDTRVPAASETAAGKVELATTVETLTGTDTTRAVTPAGLAARFPTFDVKTYYILGGSTSWPNAINSAIAAANTNGGGIIRFPENTTITMGAVATLIGSNITLQIPRSCTIVKSNGAFNHIFGLAAPTYPAYTENVHIIGGTWKWTTATDPGGDDQRGPIMFKYGNNVSVRDADFQCLSTSHPTRRTSGPYFQWCNRAKLLNCTITDAAVGVTASAQSAPDNAGRTMSDIVIQGNEIVRTATPASTSIYGVFAKGDYANSRTLSNVKVTDNIITKHGMGIEVGPGNTALVANNTITEYILGISMADMSKSRVTNNDLSNSVTGRQIGIEVTGAANSRVTNNKIIDTGQTIVPGIGIYGSSSTRNSNYTEVLNNYIEGGSHGVQLIDNASYCRAQGNTLRSNTIGVRVGPTYAVSTANTVYNVIDGNLIDRPTSYGVSIATYSTFSTTNLVIANNVLIGATATINGTVNGVSSQNVTAT